MDRYNNDHLVKFCSEHLDTISRDPAGSKRLTKRLQQRFQRPCSASMIGAGWSVLAFNNKRHDPAVSFKAGLPRNLIAVHHVNKTGIGSLNRLERHAKKQRSAATLVGPTRSFHGACTSTSVTGNFMVRAG